MKNTWGPFLWHIIHTIAKNYPEKPTSRDKYYARQMINSLAFIIPCFKCQKHYMENITKHKPNFDSGINFFKWTVKLHNIVNKLNNKKIWTFNQAYNVTESCLDSNKIKKLFVYLRVESNNYNISKVALIKFIDIITYFNNNFNKRRFVPTTDIRLSK